MSAFKRTKRRFNNRPKLSAKFQLPKDAVIDYKNLPLIQRYINDRGKLVPRRISGLTAKEQRQISIAVKRARFMALLTTGGARR